MLVWACEGVMLLHQLGMVFVLLKSLSGIKFRCFFFLQKSVQITRVKIFLLPPLHLFLNPSLPASLQLHSSINFNNLEKKKKDWKNERSKDLSKKFSPLQEKLIKLEYHEIVLYILSLRFMQ